MSHSRTQDIENRLQDNGRSNGTRQSQAQFETVTFRKARRQNTRIKILLTGFSGSGKTWGLLRLATGLAAGGKIVLLDSEGGSGELYADQFDYDYARINPPYTPETFIHYLDSAIAAGYDVVGIDSISLEWQGVLEIAENAKQTVFGGWATATPRHNRFVEAVLNRNVHIIATCRLKQGYEMTKNYNGKDTPRKTDIPALVQKDQTEYDYTCVFRAMGGEEGLVIKDRTSLFSSNSVLITEETGQKIREWTNGGNRDTLFEEFKQRLNATQTVESLRSVYSSIYPIVKNWGVEKRVQELEILKEKLKDQYKQSGTAAKSPSKPDQED